MSRPFNSTALFRPPRLCHSSLSDIMNPLTDPVSGFPIATHDRVNPEGIPERVISRSSMFGQSPDLQLNEVYMRRTHVSRVVYLKRHMLNQKCYFRSTVRFSAIYSQVIPMCGQWTMAGSVAGAE